MKQQIDFQGRSLTLTLSPAAEQALSQRKNPLLVEMELYFSCLIRKAVRFRDSIEQDSVKVSPQLALRFRPVMTQHCSTDYSGDEPPLTDFPIIKVERYIPHWLKIDFDGVEWHGEFGYTT